MKKNRFLWIRNLPDGCKCSDIRSVLDRFGEVQALRIFKDVDLRHAVLAFSDINSAIRASTSGIKIKDTHLKLEYCDSLDVAELLHKLHQNSGQNPNGTNKKSNPLKSPGSDALIKCNGQLDRSPSVSKSVNGRVCFGKPLNNALRPQNSCLSPTWRGIKISNLPTPSKLSDEHLRHSLFKEFRCFGRILSVFLSRSASGSCEAPRDAIITFQRSSDAQNAYHTLHKSSKLLFSSEVAIEPHLGVEVPADGSSSLSLTNHISEKTDTIHPTSVTPNMHLDLVMAKSHMGLDLNAASSRCPTRTLCVGGLTAGPTGPVTEEQLTAAFRKFGDITDIHLQSSTNSALIQFTEMRGPLRAMNAHSRDPLRLGGRPLFLAYVPSQPSTGLWFSEMPAALAALGDEELFHRLSKLAPIQEITLISRPQPGQTPSTSVNNFQPPHYVAYVRLATVGHASQLLTELRCKEQFEINGQTSSDPPSGLASRRLIAVDFASSRQTALVNSLRLNASKPGASSRIRVISLSSINRAKESKSSNSSSRDSTAAFARSTVCSSANTDTIVSRTNGISATTHLNTAADSHQPKDRLSRASCGSEFGDPFTSVNLRSSSQLRDSSPSSMSTTSSSSLSSESTSSSTSISSSTVSSCTSSGSSARSKSHRIAKNQGLQSKAAKQSTVRRTLPVNSTAKSLALPLQTATTSISFTENSAFITTISAQPVSSYGGITTTSSIISSHPAHSSASTACHTQRPSDRQSSRRGSTTSDNNFEAFLHTLPSFPTSSSATTLPGTVHLSPTTRHTPLSASSGVSSGCNSSSDSSPFSSTHQYTCPALNVVNGGIANQSRLQSHEHLSSPTVTSHAKAITVRQSPSSTAEAKSRVYCSEASSGLKLHLSANGPSSTSPSNLGSPLTVSIKLTNNSRSQSSALRSPLGHSDIFDRPTQRVRGSTPSTPLSAPPFRGLPRERTSSAEAGDGTTGGASSHSTDWFSVESPVYESMYDKIKRRTNKEAEKRRQRQLEALTAKDKKRRRHQQKDCLQFRKSPLSVAPYIFSESFGNGHSAKMALATSSDKLHRSKSEHTKPELGVTKTKRRVKPRPNRSGKEKSFSLNGSPSPWKSSKQYDPTTVDRRLNSVQKTQRETKEVRRNTSPLLSPSSADECDSSSPPGTLTRLSLGMRFPVSATYHECVRPSTKSRSKWSTDDESLSRRSSLSFSGSDISERHARKTSNWSDILTKMERTNGHVARKKNVDAASVTGTRKLEKCPSAHSKVGGKLNHKDHSDSWPSDNRNRLDGFTLSCITNRVSHKTSSKTVANVKREPREPIEDSFNYAAGKKRRRDRAQSFADDRKRQRIRLRTELREHKNHSTYSSSKNLHTSDDALNSDSDFHRFAPNDLPSSVVDAFTSGRWPPSCRRRLISGSMHSITDDSSQPVTRSPSPVPASFLNKSSGKRIIMSSSMCSDSVGHVDDEHDSAFGAFRDCDRFSSSKSTPSTEPMEQDEFVERDCYMKFCEDDWHSSIVSTSPHPTTLDFDVDYCPIDKTEQSSTTYQSTSFSSQLLSPLGKLPSPTPEDSDEDDVRLKPNDKLYVTVADPEQQNTLKLFPSSFSSPSFHASFEELPVSQHSGVYEASDPCSSCSQNARPTCTSFLQDSTTSDLGFPATDVANEHPEGSMSLPPLSSTAQEVPNTRIPAIPVEDSQQHLEQFVAATDPLDSIGAPFNANSVVNPDFTSSLASPADKSMPSTSHAQTTEQNSLSGSQLQKDSNTSSLDTSLQPVCSLDTTQSSNSVASPSKKAIPTNSDSSKPQPFTLLSPTKPPTDTHDITRYVQSVIERVKAEKVEETQQAASALHHSMGTPTNSVINVLQVSKLDNSLSLNNTSQSSTTTAKRSSTAHRKPLVVAASKAGHGNNVPKTPVPIAMAHNVIMSSPYNVESSHSESLAATPSHGPSTNVVSTVSPSMPSIPGVNACTPLAVSLPFNPNRVTRQASQMLQSYSLSATKCSEATTTVTSPAVQTSPTCAVSTVQSVRRRRRSEGKGAKESTHVCSISSAQFSTKTVPLTTSVVNCKPQSVCEELVEGFMPGVASSLPGKPQSSVDPYEPNFDDESPPGFEHSQLHPNRSTSPICSSPVTQPPCAVDNRKVASPTASPVVSSHPVCSVTEASCPNTANSDIPPSSESSVSLNNVTDSVDEVIRDVCAGQFDVQSYLNSWRSEPTSKATCSPNPGAPIQTNAAVTPISSASRSTSVTPSVASVQPFPLSLASEPVVAAVTIPVSSGAGVSKSSSVGQNGQNNVVNIGTGNALLNTLVAALQLIPGSQVTVTGPAAAAGVVGAMGTGTISATTITLPVTAARQAAANIKAAVLSATGAITTGRTETHQTDIPTSKMPSTQTVSLSASAASEPLSGLKPPLVVSTSAVMPPLSLSENSITATAASSLDSSASIETVKSPHGQTNSFPVKVPGASLKIPMSVSVDGSKPNVFTEPSLPVQLHATKDSDSTSTNCRLPVHSFSNRVRSATLVHPHHVSTAASSALPPVSSSVSTQHNYRSCSRTPSTSSVISHTIQAFADRLGNTVEPSVLMTLAQAAATSSHVRGTNSETGSRSETDNQIFNYLRRLATRLSDPCPGGSVNRQPVNVVPLDSQGQNLLNTSSPPLATPHLSHIAQQHQRFPPVTCSLYVNSAGPDAAAIPRPDVNPPISPSLISPRAFSGHPGPSAAPTSVNHLAWSSLGQAYPLVWQGRLSLKNAETRVALHYIYGNLNLLHDCMRLLVSGGGGQSLVSSSGPLRIVQRMRLEISQLEGVQRKIHQEGASCVCLALPAGNSPVELMQQTQILNDSFIRYMQEKMAAGIINVGLPELQQTLYVVHIFPPCDFSFAQLNVAAPDLHCRVVQANQSHLLVVVTTV